MAISPEATLNVGEAKRTMYTPVFYTQSQTSMFIPSLPTKGLRKGKEREQIENISVPNLRAANLKRLEELSKRHIALAHEVEEVPDSLASDDDLGEGPSKPRETVDVVDEALVQQDLAVGIERKIATNPRIRRLRDKLAAALADAQYNPCHGRWETISELVRMGVTTGRPRWARVRRVRKGSGKGNESVEVEIGKDIEWCNASTEEEWFEWEKKYLEAQSKKKRVAEWTRAVVSSVAPEVDPEIASQIVVPPITRREEEQEPAKVPPSSSLPKSSNPLSVTNNSLGFSMAKRTAVTVVARASNKAGGPHNSSMPPPSFRESQLITSTPLDAQARPESDRPPNLPASPPLHRVSGCSSQGTPSQSPSMPVIPSPPPKSPTTRLRPSISLLSSNGTRMRSLVPVSPPKSRPAESHDSQGHTVKRKNEADQEAPKKRPRMEDSLYDIPDPLDATTPKKAPAPAASATLDSALDAPTSALPTLTELLASAKNNTPKRKKPRPSLFPTPTNALSTPNSKSKAHPQQEELSPIPGLTAVPRRAITPSQPTKALAIASADVDAADADAVNLSLDMSPPVYPPPNGNLDLEYDDGHGAYVDADDQRVLDFDLESLGEHNPFAAGGIYDIDEADLASPAKSLSSLAGSDSEDDPIEEDEEDERELDGDLPVPSGGDGVRGGEEGDLSFNPDAVSTQLEEQARLRAAATGQSAATPTKNELASSRKAPTFFNSSNPFLSSLSQQPTGMPSPAKSTVTNGSGRGGTVSPGKSDRLMMSSSQPSLVYGKYNSQFDVKARVDEVDRLLGRDLEYDWNGESQEAGEGQGEREQGERDVFGAWLKDEHVGAGGDGEGEDY